MPSRAVRTKCVVQREKKKRDVAMSAGGYRASMRLQSAHVRQSDPNVKRRRSSSVVMAMRARNWCT
eukprot:3437025-Rhodomonas_salina.1